MDSPETFGPFRFLKKISILVVACYLISAVVFKIIGGGASEKSFPPAVELLAIQSEVLIGVWLLTGRLRFISWVGAVALFLVLSLTSLTTAIRGYSDCGCFGPIRINPYITTVFNLFALLLLFVGRPEMASIRLWWAILGSVGLALVGMTTSAFADGALGDQFLAYLKRDLVYLSPSYKDIGSHPQGAVAKIQFGIVNKSNYPIKVIGGRVSCNCAILNNLPLIVPANESLDVDIEMNFIGKNGVFTHTFYLFTDSNKNNQLNGIVTGRVSSLDIP